MSTLNRRLTDPPSTCSKKVKKQLKKRLPILTWLPKYKKGHIVADLIAGIAVGLTVVPQSMAYANIAGLTPEFGLYSSYIGCFLYVILGSCRQVTIGPTAIMGLLTFETCGADFPACVVLTGFYSGVFELFMACLQLGWLVSFISEPVVIGFTAGAATTIMSSQVKNFLGLSGPKGNGFVGYWTAIVTSISTISLADSVMGVCSFIALLLLRQLKEIGSSRNPRYGKILKKSCWLISVARNVIIVVVTTLIAYLWTDAPFKLTGKVVGGFPPVGPPQFNLPQHSNSSDPDQNHTVFGSWSILGAGPLVIALISVLQNVAISKAFGSGQRVDATQEMLALGMSSIVGSFFSAIPISGSFSRSAVNEASGVRSSLCGLFTGTLVLMSLGFLTPTFYYIPKASLAAIIISAVMFMIEFQTLGVMWKINRMDLVSCLLTFICSILIGMEYGIIIGVGISLTVLLMKSLKPNLYPELVTDPSTGIVYLFTKPESALTFPSVDNFRSSITKLSGKFQIQPNNVNININGPIIVISFEKWTTLDYTVVTAISSLVKSFKKENRVLILVDCGQSWINAFQNAGLDLADIPHSSFFDLSDYLRKVGRNCIDNQHQPNQNRGYQENNPHLQSNFNHYGSVGESSVIIAGTSDSRVVVVPEEHNVTDSKKPLL